jgi:hypothetical protein
MEEPLPAHGTMSKSEKCQDKNFGVLYHRHLQLWCIKKPPDQEKNEFLNKKMQTTKE